TSSSAASSAAVTRGRPWRKRSPWMSRSARMLRFFSESGQSVSTSRGIVAVDAVPIEKGHDMLRGMTTFNITADDPAAAADWYAGILGEPPYFRRDDDEGDAAYI